jgi:hypothetical protein
MCGILRILDGFGYWTNRAFTATFDRYRICYSKVISPILVVGAFEILKYPDQTSVGKRLIIY